MGNKKRILLTSPSALNNGGVQYVLMTIVRNLSNQFIFDILTFNSHQNFYNEEFKSYGGNIYCFNPKNKSGILYRVISFFTIRKYLSNLFRNNDYYAIHCNSQFINGTILKTAFKFSIGIRISHSHGTYKKENLFREIYRRYYRRLINKYATNKIGCSTKSCQTFYGSGKKWTIINNPYDNTKIKTFTKTPNNLVLLQIGSFFPNKNHIFSIEVLYYIKKTYKDALLRIVGNGDSEPIKQKIQSLNLDDSVIFHKSNEDKKYLFENSSYLIIPSYSEGFPIVLIEAQAGGLHCFASDSIADETNLGGVIYLPLKEGPEKWSKTILEYYNHNKGNKGTFNCSDFTIDFFISNIKCIYKHKYN